MQYNLGQMRKLGFGLMRLPECDGKIDMDTLCAMVDHYLAHGYVYFDTAYVYHNGYSEMAVKDALVKRHPRESFALATKLPGWQLHDESDVQRIFDEQLERTGAEYFDYYLLHAIGEASNSAVYDRLRCWDFLGEMKDKGLVHNAGFSFHGDPDLLENILQQHPEVDFVQLQINYLDWKNPIIKAKECYEITRRHGKKIIIMEPVKGGILSALPSNCADILSELNPEVSQASFALRFATSLEGVEMVLSGMSTPEQVEDNLKTFDEFTPLRKEENEALRRIVDIMYSVPTIQCTNCRYCVDGCPANIRIPDLIRCLNNTILEGYNFRAQKYYESYTEEGNTASACVECGQCEGICPQHLHIIDAMKESASLFEKTAG